MITFRISFDGQVPIYPDDFKWEPGCVYAHIVAGGFIDEDNIFFGEQAFLESVRFDPPQKGWTRIVAKMEEGDVTLVYCCQGLPKCNREGEDAVTAAKAGCRACLIQVFDRWGDELGIQPMRLV